MRYILYAAVAVTAILLPCQLRGDHWYTEYWQRFRWKMWSKDPFTISTRVQLRSGDYFFDDLIHAEINELFAYKVSESVTLEMHHTFVYSRPVVPGSDWRWRYRAELEANRSFKLPADNAIRTRNRLEIEVIQHDPNLQFVGRQRTLFYHPIKCNKWVTGYSIHNEIFYHFNIQRVTQDRVCPVQLTIAIDKDVTLEPFLLFRFFTHQGVWLEALILGSDLNF